MWPSSLIRELANLTEEAVAGFPSVRVLNADALANKNTLNPILIESVEQADGPGPVPSIQAGGQSAL